MFIRLGDFLFCELIEKKEQLTENIWADVINVVFL